jgi:hypothetical protein
MMELGDHGDGLIGLGAWSSSEEKREGPWRSRQRYILIGLSGFVIETL